MASASVRMPGALQHILDALSAAHPNKAPTVGEFCVAYLKAQSCCYQQLASTTEKQLPSLLSATVNQLFASLNEDLRPTSENVRVVRETCDKNENIRRHVLGSPKLSYAMCRLLIQDSAVDNWVLTNDAAIRKMNAEDQLNSLVKLNQGDLVWPGSQIMEGKRVITRKLPPREVITVFDECRKKTVRVLPDDMAFSAAWKVATGGLLEGMDWSNIVVAGGICLGILTGEVETLSDIDIFIHGLTAKQANEKIKHIFETWSRNLGPLGQPFIFRNAKTITFIGRYPERQIQIVLKLCPTIADVLLKFDLDQCAIGWNGSEVFMLPRAARALETGYTIFTTDLIYGHYLSSRRSTQETRVLKYAERGYGLLFTSDILRSSDVDFSYRDSHIPPYTPHSGNSESKDIHNNVPNESRLTGKKAFKKIQWNANNQVQYLCFGRRRGYDYIENFKTKMRDAELRDRNTEEQSFWCHDARIHSINFPDPLTPQHLGTPQQDAGQRGRQNGLKTAEDFLRMCALWNLYKNGQIETDIRISQAYGSSYGINSYTDVPVYEWSPDFETDSVLDDLHDHNNQLFYAVKRSIETYLNRPPTYVGYFNRRFRRFMGGPYLYEVMEKQITLPLWVPIELERHIEAVAAKTSQTILIKATNKMSDIHERTETEDWNLRIWIISHETMWAHSVSRELDEIFEVLWAIFYLNWDFSRKGSGINLALPAHQREKAALQDILALLENRQIPDKGLTEEQIARKRWNDWLMGTPEQLNPSSDLLNRNHIHPFYSKTMYGNNRRKSVFWSEEDEIDDKGVWRDWKDAQKDETPSYAI
ncbi:hypothetical protein BZA77DRAFT_319653 [Pyronema omphalodes]|nr:hypothetical protein BZA77DRAFT_319653 [Pyronema omphalodes]